MSEPTALSLIPPAVVLILAITLRRPILTLGETMKRVTDRFRISREMLAYVVDSTAAPICVLVPLSTWAVFFGGLLENNDIAATGEGISVYIQAIPYMLYAWFAVILVLLVAAGVVPAIG